MISIPDGCGTKKSAQRVHGTGITKKEEPAGKGGGGRAREWPLAALPISPRVQKKSRRT